ncbi:carbon-nitrogen hydrolase family protein [Lacibacter sediminis]|uniref:Carbon-nitrogen hydrolase family protein n=1 Tax=Lacibacter sediminis TaxID=2760713 RepID=A0A7G5XED3_9BACT|nr:carbon-nitrogen hydrolase family protein [Lacibacter sediminis]QNA43836.1 carbon-nitrogen hydrolase family protein [Lacibacter sediminis]
MKKFFLRIGIMIVILLSAYFIWSLTGRAKEKETGWSKLPEFKARFEYVEAGIDSGKGNIIGIQPYLTATSYSTAFNFEVSLRFYFEQLKRENKLTDKSIVVLPEYIGTWLVAANEKETIYKQETIEKAMTTMVRSNLFSFFYGYLKSPAKDKSKYAIFHLKAEKMAKQYQQVFSTLAKVYKCTIVAGSIALPDASINSKGEMQIKSGAPIYNTSVVFGNDGEILSPLIKKLFPIDDEQGFTAAADTELQPVFTTKAGKMAVLICADSWYPQAYNNLTNKADFIVVPSLGDKDSVWLAAWKGYNGFKAPVDVDTTDYKKISEGDAWLKYSMNKRAATANIHQGMNVFFTGSLWDMKPEGRVLILQNDSTTVLPASVGKGRIVNLYLQ